MKHNKLISAIIGLILFLLTINLNAQVPCSSRLISNIDFAYTGGGATPNQWDITQTDATSDGFTISTGFTYATAGMIAKDKHYAIVNNPNTLNATNFANVTSTSGGGILVLTPDETGAPKPNGELGRFYIGGLVAGQTYNMEIKVWNLDKVASPTTCCWDDVFTVEAFTNNPGDNHPGGQWTTSSTNGTGTMDMWGNQGTNNVLRPDANGRLATLKGAMTLRTTTGTPETSITLVFYAKDKATIGIESIKIYGCQTEAITANTGAVDGGKVCESTPITLTAQGLGSFGSTYTWTEKIGGGPVTTLPGTGRSINITTAGGKGTTATYTATGEWSSKTISFTSQLCCYDVGDVVEVLRYDFPVNNPSCVNPRGILDGTDGVRIDPNYKFWCSGNIPDENDAGLATACGGGKCAGAYAVIRTTANGTGTDTHWPGWNGAGKTLTEHTAAYSGKAGTGMLAVNASASTGTFFEYDLPPSAVCDDGSAYQFSAWYASADPAGGDACNFDFELVDKSTNTVVEYTSTGKYGWGGAGGDWTDVQAGKKDRWQKTTLVFTTLPGKTYMLRLVNKATGVSGNDVLIDDILITKCLPKIDFFSNDFGVGATEAEVCHSPVKFKIQIPTSAATPTGSFEDLFPLKPTLYFQLQECSNYNALTQTGTWTNTGSYITISYPYTIPEFSIVPEAIKKAYRVKITADPATVVTTTAPSATCGVLEFYTRLFQIKLGSDINVTVSPASTSVCVGSTLTLTGSSTDPISKWGWMKGTDTIPGYELSTDVPKKTLTRTFATGDGGNYYFVVKNENGCEGKFLATVTEKSIPTVNNVPNQTILSGTSSSAVTLSSTPAGATYSWSSTSSNASGATASGTGNIPARVLTGTSATVPGIVTYTITPTLNSCVGPTNSFDVNIAKLVAVKSGTWDTSILKGKSIDFIIDTSGSILPTGGSITTDWETSTDGGLTWIVSPAPPFSPTVDTKYKATVTMKDASNATVGAPIVITQDVVVLNIIIGNDSTAYYCPGENVSLVGYGQNIVSWSWYLKGDVPPAVGASSLPADKTLNLLNVVSDTTWYFRGFTADAIPFFADQEFKVRKRPDYTFTVDKTTVGACQNEVITITATKSIAAAPDATYTWTGLAGTTNVLTNIFTLNTTIASSGTINVEAQATGYCNTNINIPYTISNLVLDTIGWNNSICKGNNTTLTVDTAGTGTLIPGATLTVLWEQKPLSQATFTTIPNGANPLVQVVTPTETTQYRITLTTKDASNNILCQKTLTHTTIVIDLGMGPKTIYTICEGASISIEGQTDGGTEWQWEDEDRNVVLPWSSNVTDKRLQNQAPLNNTVYYFVARNGACIAEQVDSVYVKPFINFTTDPSSVITCKGEAVNIVPTSTIPVSGVSYSWSLDNGAAINTNTYTLPTGTAKNGTINVTSSATGYCATTIAIPYSVSELIITPDNWPTTFCPNDNITLTANVNQIGGTLPMTMEWYENGTAQGANSVSSTFSPTGTSTYTFEVSTAVCSSKTYSQEITEVNVNIDIEENSYLSCPGNDISLTAITDATGNYSITWSKQGESDLTETDIKAKGNIITVNPSENTKYIATITNTGCQDTANVMVYMYPVPEIIDVTELDPRTIQIIANGGIQPYQYSVDDLNNFIPDINIFDNLRIGKHIAYVMDYNNCKTSIPFVINEIPLEFPPYFSPNEDGFNDKWIIKNIELYYQIDLQIFDRFGKNLIKITNPSMSWDGNYNNKPLPSDDYWYILSIKETGKKFVGHFSIIR